MVSESIPACRTLLIVLLFLIGGSPAGSATGVQTGDQTWLPADPEKTAGFEKGTLYTAGKIPVVVLNGSFSQMGRQYGELLKPWLESFRQKALFLHYPEGERNSFDQERPFAEENYSRYPDTIHDFFEGMAEQSGIPLEDLILLDQYVLLCISEEEGGCSQLAAWGEYTPSGSLVFGKNEDYYEYFKEFNDSIVVTVFFPDDGSIPVATIGNAGEISTMNALNLEGLVLAMNAAPSEYDDDELETDSIMPFMQFLLLLFESPDLASFDRNIRQYTPAFPYILNTADLHECVSYESSVDTTIRRVPHKEFLFATNHFIDPSWEYDRETNEILESCERYENLLQLIRDRKGRIDPGMMMQMLDLRTEEGGVTNPETIYQFIAEPVNETIWIKIPGYQDWTGINVRAISP
ncbi:MAG: hypothetical protein JXA44_07740 [Methanospirillaceae archaeon]|nr:hypothetical protein [Methanospirillaceae archaeon]